MLNPAPPPHYEDDIDLLRYGRFLASYWLVLLVCGAVGLVAGVAFAARSPVLYQATVTMNVSQPAGGASLALTPATSRVLLANLTLVSETLAELKLEGSDLTPQTFVQDALVIQPVPTTNLVRVSVSLPDATKARMAADLLTKKAVTLSRRLETEGAVATRDALKVQMDQAARRFDEVQSQLLTFQRNAQIELRVADLNSHVQQRTELGKAVIDLETEKARLASLEQALAQQPAVLSAPRAGEAEALLGRGRDDAPALDLSQPFANPVYGMLQYEIAATRAKVSSLERQRRQTLSPANAVAVKQLNDLYRLQIDLSRLQADYDVSKRVYSDLAGRYGEATGRTVATMPQLQIVDAPVQPDRPLPRRRAQYAMLGGLFGLVCGGVAALVVNRRRTLRSVR